MRIVIEKGYIKIGMTHLDGTKENGGWVADDKGTLYAVVMVDENFEPIGEAECAIDIESIPSAIRNLLKKEVKQ